jgi:ATP-dependent exoDNAse (exonuclease V) beta subunit
MLVGDPQQSIYGFRQADYKLFEDRTQVTTTLQLGTNFRTAPKVLQFVDETFQKMWDSKYVAMNPGLGTPGRVEIWKTAPKLWSQFAIWVKEFLTDNPNVNAGDIAVLVRQGSTAAMVQQSLTQAGLQARIAGGSEKFFSRMPIRDLANAMEALSDPESDFALLALLRSPIVSLSLDSIVLLQAAHQDQDVPLRDLLFQFDCPIPEDQAKIGEFLGWFVPIASYADRHAAWEVLSKIMFQSPYLKKVGATANALQSLANIRKLFTMAVQHPDLGPKEFAEKIRRITTLNVKEGDAPAVDDDDHTIQIMTVHKAKGLEFKVVILADLFKPTKPRKSILNALLVDQNTGLVFLKTEIESLSYRWYFEQMAQETVAEEQRVLYVAMTRAQETLIMMVGNSRGESFAKSLAMYAEEQPFVGLIDLTRSANLSDPGDEFATE